MAVPLSSRERWTVLGHEVAVTVVRPSHPTTPRRPWRSARRAGRGTRVSEAGGPIGATRTDHAAVALGGAASEALPMVLVHGIGVSGRYFLPLAAELGRTGPVLVPDLPGFGDSPRTDVPLSIEDHGRVLVEVVRRSGLERPVLVGHSMGAQVVAEAARQAPGLAGLVVLVGPVIEPGARSALRQAWRLARDSRHETAASNLLMVTDWFRCGPRWYLATVPAMIDYPLEEHVGQIEEPVVLVRGVKDTVARTDYLRLLADRARDARIVEVPREGHVIMMRRPAAVARMLRSLR